MLDQILAHKRREVAARRSATSIESLLARCRPAGNSLSRALSNRRPGFLLEIKFASPSAGAIRPGADLEPVLASYGRHADAVSVLTDRQFFGGSLERLAEVRARLSQPLLCKDFILEPYQVAEARAHGADAILLILAAVDDTAWGECAALAGRLGMEVLTEVHDRAEAERAVALGARIIGVNNRDLRTLAVDPGTLARLAPLFPAERLVVGESGFASRDQVQAARAFADGFLIGTALMREPDLDGAVREMVYGRTKICGLTGADAGRTALECGATHGGVVFAAGSPRRVSEDQADSICRQAALRWVGVFADQEPEEVARLAARLGLAAVQLHGTESPEAVARVRRAVPRECEVWKAVSGDGEIPLRWEAGADRILVDGPAPPPPEGRGGNGIPRGGRGRSFDWSRLEGHRERGEVILAGGLGPANVAAAAALGTWALDASSGVESAPGQKDPERLRAFFSQRRRFPGRSD